MTKGEAIELVFLDVNGGKPTPDNSVMRADIRTYLPASVNYAMDVVYNNNLQIEGDRDFPSEFYSVFEDIAVDRTERLPFIPLTLGTAPLKGGAGIRFVYDNCGVHYGMLPDSELSNAEYYSKMTPGMGWYRRTGNNLILYGINPIAEKINYQAITKVEDLADTDELPIQAGAEERVLDKMKEWFAKKFGYDTKVDSRDTNAVDA